MYSITNLTLCSRAGRRPEHEGQEEHVASASRLLEGTDGSGRVPARTWSADRRSGQLAQDGATLGCSVRTLRDARHTFACELNNDSH